MEDSAPKLYTITETARLIGVHFTTLRRWADRGDVPVTRLPSGHRRFTREQVAEIQRRLISK